MTDARAAASLLLTLLAAAGPLAGQVSAPTSDCPLMTVGTGDRTMPEVKPGAVIRSAKVVYPAALRSRNIEGRVALRFVVRCNGRADSSTIVVLQLSDPGFIRAAIDVVLHSSYSPATYRGRSVASTVEQSVRFNPKSMQ